MANNHSRPAYLLRTAAELAERIATARGLLSPCRLCPRACGADRLGGERGFCRTGAQAVVASAQPHFGEEDPLVGEGGSGTIFFTHCNLGCVFCQNWEISHEGAGRPVTAAQLAAMMVGLQRRGCHNINFVTPSHVVPAILEALPQAIDQGLSVPLVYNSGGYDAPEALALLDGVVDIYMPDFKFWSPARAKRFCLAADYPERARTALTLMHRQVGDLVLDERGVARRGLLVRHLIMPGCLDDTNAILRFLADEISPATYLNLMDQYHPCGEAAAHPPLDRALDRQTYENALELARAACLARLDERNWLRILRRMMHGG